MTSYEKALNEMEKTLGRGGVNRLRTFLGECMKADINPQASAKSWRPFKRLARIRSQGRWPKSKSRSVTMFYFRPTRNELRFSMNHYKKVKGFNVNALERELRGLGFQAAGKQAYRIDLRAHNDQIFFDKLIELVLRTARALELTLQKP